jgi:hypothetical protein
MLKRLLVGLVVGIVIGGVAAAAIIKGLGVTTFAATGIGPAFAYLAAIATGVVAGLVAGKPIWAKGAWIEVGLKAFFGSLLAAGAMFALRRWGTVPVDLAALGAGPIGLLPATSLPILATILSVFYELDNTDAPEGEASASKDSSSNGKGNKRVAAPKRVATLPDEGEGEDEEAPKKQMKH